VGLVVDRLLGASQTVIKPLGPLFQEMRGIGGATLLGTGEVGFVIDVSQVVRTAAGKARPELAA
jgi:two-component system, chemotaxis family, sensor kinase CheA